MPSSPHRIARRDYLLIPATSLITVILMFALCEVTARALWPEVERDSCAEGSATTAFGHKPNCTSRLKNAEGVWSTNHYNECGYRSFTSCGPKPAGSVRIAVIGSSVSQGLYIPYAQTFTARAAAEVQRQCGKQIDVQNMGVANASPIFVYRRLDRALAMKPDVVLFALAPFDLEQQIDAQQLAGRNDPDAHFSKPAAKVRVGLMKRLQTAITQSRTVVTAQHFLFQDKRTFLKLYLMYGDKADFLRKPLTPAWEKRFADLDLIIGDMAERTRAAGSRLIVMPVPSRAEAALLSDRHPGPKIDAAAFGERLEKIAAQHNADFIDVMDKFSHMQQAENLYYVVDGHVTPDGQSVLGDALTAKLLDGSIPGLADCSGEKKKS